MAGIPAPQQERGVEVKLYRFLVAHKLLIAVILTVATLALGSFALQVTFDNTIESYFLEDDIRDYNRFLESFGTDEFVVVAFGGENVFTVENLRLIDRISSALAELPHVRRVLSLTSASIVVGTGDSVSFEDVAPAVPTTAAEAAAIRRKALADPILPGVVVSSDGRNTAIVAEIEHFTGAFDYKVSLLRDVRSFLAEQEARTGKHFAVGGTAVLDDALFRYTRADQVRFLPLMLMIIVVIMYAIFRRVTTALLPMLVVAVATTWTYGFMSLLGYKINVISTILGPLLLSVGIADAVHVIADYLERTARGPSSRLESMEQSFRALLAPCVLTTVTTILGLLSLLSADLVPIRQFGVVAAVGVSAALIVTVLLLPIVLAVIPATAVATPTAAAGEFAALLARLGVWRRRRARAILAGCLIAVGPAVLSLTRLTVGTNSLDYFRPGDPVRQETEWIDAHIGGTASLEFLIDAGAADDLIDPLPLEKIERMQDYLERIDGITNVYSVVDLLKTLNRAFHQGDERAFRLPSSRAEAAQELLVIEGSDELEAVLSPDYSQARITARVAMGASQRLAQEMPGIEAEMHTVFGPSPKIAATGLVYLLNRMEHYLLASQIKSFLLAFTVVGASIVVALRSWKLGLLAMIPNVLPVLGVIALMPVLGINLDVGTVMIASVALGLIVDDTIHFMYRLKSEATHDSDMREVIARTMHEAGRPIIYTSIVLSLGFSVLVFASFNPVIHFGLLASTVILLALLADLVVLPALLGFVGITCHERKTGGIRDPERS